MLCWSQFRLSPCVAAVGVALGQVRGLNLRQVLPQLHLPPTQENKERMKRRDTVEHWGLAVLPWRSEWPERMSAKHLCLQLISPWVSRANLHDFQVSLSFSFLSKKGEHLSRFILFLQVSFFHSLYSEKIINLFLPAFSSELLLAL